MESLLQSAIIWNSRKLYVWHQESKSWRNSMILVAIKYLARHCNLGKLLNPVLTHRFMWHQWEVSSVQTVKHPLNLTFNLACKNVILMKMSEKCQGISSIPNHIACDLKSERISEILFPTTESTSHVCEGHKFLLEIQHQTLTACLYLQHWKGDILEESTRRLLVNPNPDSLSTATSAIGLIFHFLMLDHVSHPNQKVRYSTFHLHCSERWHLKGQWQVFPSVPTAAFPEEDGSSHSSPLGQVWCVTLPSGELAQQLPYPCLRYYQVTLHMIQMPPVSLLQ